MVQQSRKQAIKLGLEFEQAKQVSTLKKEELVKAKQKLHATEDKLMPLQGLLKEMNTRNGKRERNYRKADDEVHQIQTAIRDAREVATKAEKDAKGVRDEMQRLKREEKRRLQKISELKAKKEHHENVLREPQEDVREKVEEKKQEKVGLQCFVR